MGSIRSAWFDVGGVLITLRHAECMANMAAVFDRNPDDVRYFLTESSEFKSFERGRINADQFLAFCNKKFDTDVSMSVFANVLNFMLQDLSQMMCDVLHALRRRRIIVASATNVNTLHRQEICSRWPQFLELFDVDGASHLLHVRKGDQPDFFETVHSEVNKRANGIGPIRREEIVFIDDGKSNCDLAHAYGLKVIHFAYEGSESVVRLKEELVSVGVPEDTFR